MVVSRLFCVASDLFEGGRQTDGGLQTEQILCGCVFHEVHFCDGVRCCVNWTHLLHVHVAECVHVLSHTCGYYGKITSHITLS
jgi:hypothetical protein